MSLPADTTRTDLFNLFRFVLNAEPSDCTVAALATRFGVSQRVASTRIRFLENLGLFDDSLRHQTKHAAAYHWDSLTDAFGVFDQAMSSLDPKPEPIDRKTTPKKEIVIVNPNIKPNGVCLCCKTKIGKRSLFAPGHDARLVSQIVSKAAKDPDLLEGLIADMLPTQALADKARAAFARRTVNKPADVLVWVEAYPVKIGRWEYPSRTNGAQVQRNTKRDGSGEWVNYS